jgi:hypothetical protein
MLSIKLEIPNLSGSYTPGTAGYRLWPKNLDTTQFPPTTNGWETKYPVSDMVPPLLDEEEGPPT